MTRETIRNIALELKQVREQKRVLENEDREMTKVLKEALSYLKTNEFRDKVISFRLVARVTSTPIDIEVAKKIKHSDIRALLEAGYLKLSLSKEGIEYLAKKGIMIQPNEVVSLIFT